VLGPFFNLQLRPKPQRVLGGHLAVTLQPVGADDFVLVCSLPVEPHCVPGPKDTAAESFSCFD